MWHRQLRSMGRYDMSLAILEFKFKTYQATLGQENNMSLAILEFKLSGRTGTLPQRPSYESRHIGI